VKTELHPCFILHHRPYRETSLLLDTFSLQYGRVNLMAKGVKRTRNNQALLLQPAKKLSIAWSMRSDMGTLTAVEAGAEQPNLIGRRLVSCFYLNELLVRMLHKHEPHPELFNKYEESLSQLSSDVPEDQVLRLFEIRLLQTLGYGLVLDHEIGTTEPIQTARRYFYQIDYGPLHDRPENARSIQVSGKTLLALHAEDVWDEEIASEAKLLLRTILATYTGPKPFASRELYKAYIDNARAV